MSRQNNIERAKRLINSVESDPTYIGNNVEISGSPLVSVVMTTYNIADHIESTINSVLNQTYQRFELIVVDDSSSDHTSEIVKHINDPRIRLFRNRINCGTYYSKNVGIMHARGSYVALHDADDTSHEFRLEKQVRQLEANESLVYSICQYIRIDSKGNQIEEPRLGFPTSLIRRKVFDEIGFFDSVRVAADDEFDSRMRWFYGRQCRGLIEEILYFSLKRNDSLTAQVKIGSEARLSYVQEYRKWHESNTASKTSCYIPFPLTSRPFPVRPEIDVPYSKEIEPTVNNKEIKTNGHQVTASLATIPSRAIFLKQVLDSLYAQVDHINVFLNDYPEVPSFLKDEKITIARSQQDGKLHDNGKFFWIDSLTGFHFTVDDDIIYPSNYVATLKEKLAEFNYEPAVGVHGILINEPFISYYEKSSRTVSSFSAVLETDKYVHILGTGTLAYHTSRVSFSLSGVEESKMIDIFFALHTQKSGTPMICVKHAADWLKEIETPKSTRLYEQFVGNDRRQTELISSRSWKVHRLSLDKNESLSPTLDSEEKIIDRIERWAKQLIEQQKSINVLEKKVNELEVYLEEKDREIEWYRGHIEEFRRHSIEYRIKNSPLMPRWLIGLGKPIKNVLLSLIPQHKK